MLSRFYEFFCALAVVSAAVVVLVASPFFVAAVLDDEDSLPPTEAYWAAHGYGRLDASSTGDLQFTNDD